MAAEIRKPFLEAENGIVPNLMDSLEAYEMTSGDDEKIWETEFLHWHKLIRTYSMGVADDYLQRFKEIKEDKRK